MDSEQGGRHAPPYRPRSRLHHYQRTAAAAKHLTGEITRQKIHTSEAYCIHTPEAHRIHAPEAYRIHTPEAYRIHTPEAYRIHTLEAYR